jgi:hypothetical protein
MWRVELSIEWEPTEAPLSADVFDLIYRELRKCGRVSDPASWGSLDAGQLTVAVLCDCDKREAAMECAFVAVRTAFHAAGELTAGWEKQLEAALAECAVTTKPLALAV